MPNSIDINELKGLPEFKKLKPEELSLVNNILTEINSSGYSPIYENLKHADFNEIPVDIETFVDDYRYLGNAWHDALGNSKLYPYWRRELKKIFPNNLDTSVNNVILGGSRGRGKAQPMRAHVYTKDGYLPMGDLTIGMEIYGSDGKLHKVSGLFPQGKKPVYRVRFSDKSECLCTDEHLWKVRDGRGGHWNVIELKDIIRNRKLKNIQYFIPMTKPLEFDLQDTFLDPFYLGCVLGKRYCSSQPSDSSKTPFPISHVDAYIINSLEKRVSLLEGVFEVSDFRVDIQDGIHLKCKRDFLPKLKFLVQSLGGTLTTTGSRRFNVLLRLDTSMYLNVLPDTYADSALKLPTPERYIEDIEYVGEEGCQCIYIDSRDHLYLTEDLIVTHNTEIAVLCAAYILYRILCLKNPIEYFHLKPSEKIVFAFMNIKLDLAEEIGISKFQNTIQSSPWFINHGEITGRTHKIWIPEKFNGRDAVEIKIGSQSDDLIGLPVLFCLDGKTPIITEEGIFNLEELEGKEIRVPTVDDNNDIVLSNKCTVRQTAESDIEYEIKLADDTIIKCTPTHRFRLVTGEYKEARDLTVEDNILDFTPYGYIYKTENILNGKIYIGQHKGEYLDSKYLGSGKLLQRAIQKYGKENFKCELLELCETKERLNEREKFYISKFETTTTSRGYNIAIGGQGGDLGPSVRQRISDSLRGIPKSEETKRKLSAANRGKHLSQSTRDKISAGNRGKVMSAESRAKISAAAKLRDYSYCKKRGGYIAVTDGISTRFIDPKVETMPLGWERGNCKTRGSHDMTRYYNSPEMQHHKSEVQLGCNNSMYGKGYLRRGGKNTNALKYYIYNGIRFECRKDLLKYLQSNGYPDASSNLT